MAFPSGRKFKLAMRRRKLLSMTSLQTVIDNVIDNAVVRGEATKGDFYKALGALTKRDIRKIERRTVGQAKNPAWFFYRRHTITGSCTRDLFFAHKKGDNSFLRLGRINKQVIIPKFYPALLWGQEHEETAIRDYMKSIRKCHVNLRCTSMGLVLYQELPFIAGRVDGVLTCDCCPSTLVEVKCPYSFRSRSLKTFGHELRYLDGELKLKREHTYFTHVKLTWVYLERNR